MKLLMAIDPSMAKNYQNYVLAFQRLGVTLIFSLSAEDAHCCEGLLLPGGGDITPSLFHQTDSASRKMDYALDIKQLYLLSKFVCLQKPVLGICKGMQLINVWFGGTLYQHLDTAALHEFTTTDQYHISYTLPLTSISSKTTMPCYFCNPLHTLYGKEFMINSAHHQGIDLLGKKLVRLQYTGDSVCEGICHTHLPILGVQWHPERMHPSQTKNDCVDGSRLLSYFIKLC